MSRSRGAEAERGRYPVAPLRRIAPVSRAASSEWKNGPPSARAQAAAALPAKIRAIHAAADNPDGVPRVRAELRAPDEDVGRRRVARFLQGAGF